MKTKTTLILIFLMATLSGVAQVPSYYNDVNLNLNGSALQNELADKVTNTQTNFLSYTPGVWDALQQADLDPTNSNRVILIYGYNDNDGVLSTDRTRGVDDNGGASDEWNREHVYPRSLGNPNLGSSGPGSDAHHLRPADPARNSSRGNRKFADGSGNSGVTSQGYYYPGDEFKGDVARMMLFMYIRYGSRCLPSNVAIGTTNSSDSNMINLLLDWNVEDPVNAFELNRNEVIASIQGNRNPFIDNPAFATSIWGGAQAEDRFGNGNSDGGNTLCSSTVTNLPYSESFESGFGVWSQSTSDSFDWTRRSGSTPSSNTGPSNASGGSTYAYMESSSPNNSNDRAILYGPCYTIPTLGADFSFNYHMFGSSAMGSLALEVSTNGTSWTSIWSRSGNQGNSWQNASVSLNNFAGTTVQLRFNGITGTTWQGDMAIDELELSSGGSTGGGGADVFDVRLDITFDNYSSETSWDIRDDNGSVIYTGGNYGNQASGSSISLTRTLEDGCYTLNFYDTFGDGICCSFGNGSYVLFDLDQNNTLTSGGSFDSVQTRNFCVGSSRQLRSSAESLISGERDFENDVPLLQVYPNPASDILYVKTSSEIGIISFVVYDQLGKVMGKGDSLPSLLSVSDWSSGMYFLNVEFQNEIKVFRFVVK